MKEPKLGWLARLGFNMGIAGIKTAISEIKDEDIKQVSVFAVEILESVADIVGSNRTNKAQLIAEMFKENAHSYAEKAVAIALLFVHRLPDSPFKVFAQNALASVKF
jgi:hypothetical protein